MLIFSNEYLISSDIVSSLLKPEMVYMKFWHHKDEAPTVPMTWGVFDVFSRTGDELTYLVSHFLSEVQGENCL